MRRTTTTPVDLDWMPGARQHPAEDLRGQPPRSGLQPLALPADLTVREALHRVLRLVSVGSKRFLTNKVDRAVTGLIARQQCCGPLQLPVGDVAVIAQSHFGLTGAATAIGEQPIKMLVDPAAGARMAVGRGADEPGLGEDRRSRAGQVLGQLDVGAEAAGRGGGPLRRGAGHARR